MSRESFTSSFPTWIPFISFSCLIALTSVCSMMLNGSFPGGSVVKNPPPSAGDMSSIPRLGRYPGIGNDNPLQYSCLGNPRARWVLAGYSPWRCKRVRHSLVTEHAHMMLNKNGKNWCSCLTPDLRVKAFSLSPLIMTLAVGFCRCPLSSWRKSLWYLVCWVWCVLNFKVFFLNLFR